MKIKRALLILTTALVVTGCTPSLEGITEALGGKEEASSEKITVEDEPLVEETTEETTEAEAESSTDETAEAEGEPVSDEELSTFTDMFTVGSSDEYFGFLWPEYSSPEEIKWDQVIAYRVDGLTEDDNIINNAIVWINHEFDNEDIIKSGSVIDIYEENNGLVFDVKKMNRNTYTVSRQQMKIPYDKYEEDLED